MDGYRYEGVPLTAGIAAELILENLKGQLLERRAISDAVLASHTSRGGGPPRGDITHIFKKALGDLRAEGAATNVSAGHWRIGELSARPLQEPAPIDAEPVAPDPLPKDAQELGEGPEAVYLYYLPTYRAHAEQAGRSKWPCKIGRTSSDPIVRITSQAATALPERPHMAAVLWTSSSADWERAFHAVLAVRGQRMPNALGSEWFETSPDEFVAIAVWLDPNLHIGG